MQRDLADAFRHIPVAPEDYWLLGFSWDDEYRTDCFLPFGLRTAPFHFDLSAKGLHFLIEAAPYIHQNSAVVHYLDDFFAAGIPGSDPTIYESRFASICTILGIRIKESKSVTSTVADFWWHRIQHYSHGGVRELQSATGYHAFCAKVIPVGRSFLRRLYDATTKPQQRSSNRHTTPGPSLSLPICD